MNWNTVDPATLGWHSAALQDTLEFLAAHNSDHVVIVENDGLAVNATFHGEPDDSSDVYAVQKALFSVLIGIAEFRGIVSVEDRLSKYLSPGWTQLPAADEARLTVRHLLTMTTGMSDDLEPEGEIGQTWRYNNPAYNYLKRILVEQTGQNLQALSEKWLLQPLEMAHTHWVDREALLPDGRPISGLTMSALDMARLGQLVLAQGRWQGEVLLSPDYCRAMFTPGSSMNPAWCYLWSRNDQSHFMVPFREKRVAGQPIPAAPRDLLMAQGYADNRLYIVPSANRVIARRGRMAFAPEQRASIDGPLWEHLSNIWAH